MASLPPFYLGLSSGRTPLLLRLWPGAAQDGDCERLLIYSPTGGTPESQREFLDTLSADTSEPGLSNDKRKGRIPPIANQFALGYTYQDVLDADQEGNLRFTLDIGTPQANQLIFKKIPWREFPHTSSPNLLRPLPPSSNRS